MNILDHRWGESLGADQVWALVSGMRPAQAGQRLLMVVQAFIDESIQPGGVFVFGGYIATAERWAEFSQEWENLLPRFGTLKPNSSTYHFKYSDMAHIPERRKRIMIFEKAAQRYALMALSCRINIAEMKRAQARLHVHGQEVDFADFCNPYHLAYRCMMDKFHNSRSTYNEFLPEGAKVDFIFDEQLGDKKAILSSWDEYVETRGANIRELYGQTPIFRSDDDFVPLQAADLKAGQMREAYVDANLGELFDKDAETGFPHLVMSWNEEELVGDFIKQIREQTDAVIYDLRSATVNL